MEYGKVKIGDVVKYNREAKKHIKSAIDDEHHVVSGITDYRDGTQHVDFEDGSGCDVYWISKVRNEKY